MPVSPSSSSFHVVVPAAGIGRRMGAEQPKQYLPLAGKPIIERTLNRLLDFSGFSQIVVAIAAEDTYWPQLAVARHPDIVSVKGGNERADSVLNGLHYLSEYGHDDDWVLVHDVARPCIDLSDVANLIAQLQTDPVGGILAVPVSDTVKRVQQQAINATVDRSELWLAQTPQMFRLGPLREALQQGLQQGAAITDEASAMELRGVQPKIVEGRATNIKITRPEDLSLAEFYWRQQTEQC